MLPSLPWSCQQLEVWPMKRSCSTKDLPSVLLPSGISLIAQPYLGYAVESLFHFYAQPYNVSEVHALAVDSLPDPKHHPWTW